MKSAHGGNLLKSQGNPCPNISHRGGQAVLDSDCSQMVALNGRVPKGFAIVASRGCTNLLTWKSGSHMLLFWGFQVGLLS